MSTLTLHGFAPSTFVRTARMAAIELGVDHELKPLDFRSESHRALHPFARMPILTDGETTVYETLAILAYLDDLAGGGRLLPLSGPRRWQQLSTVSALLDYAYEPVVHGEDEASEATSKQVFGWVEGLLADTANLAGDEIGAADLLLAPMITHRAAKPENTLSLSTFPALNRWFAAMAERASFKESAA